MYTLKHTYLSVSTQIYKWVLAKYCWGQHWDGLASHSGGGGRSTVCSNTLSCFVLLRPGIIARLVDLLWRICNFTFTLYLIKPCDGLDFHPGGEKFSSPVQYRSKVSYHPLARHDSRLERQDTHLKRWESCLERKETCLVRGWRIL